MAEKNRQIFSKFISSKMLRTVIRNRQFKWFAVLTMLSFILVIVISFVEIRANDNFDSFSDIFYWAMITITTVGYGDISPVTDIGRFFTVPLIMIGVALVSFMTATIASILTATRIREGMGLKKIELDGHIVVCGYNSNIERVLKSIITSAQGPLPDVVLVNSHDETGIIDIIERFPELPLRFVRGDYSLESTLNRASINTASSAVILADPGPEGTAKPDDRTLLTVLAIKSMSQDAKVCVELLEDQNEVHLRRAGVDQIVVSGEFSGFLLANAVMSPGIPQALKEMMLTNIGSDIKKVKIPSDLVGKTFREASAEYYDRFGNILIGVVTEHKSFSMETVLTGEKGAIDDFIRRKFEEAGRSLEVESKGILSVNINPGAAYVISEYDFAVILTSKSETTAG